MGDQNINGPVGWELSSLSLSTADYDEKWAEAEARAEELIACIRPSGPSEARRRSVIAYVERLIEGRFDCKVFPFGSVPLKTYLPDGDIDLTAISEYHHHNESWAQEVFLLLEREEHSRSSRFQVKEVKCIQAEVSVVKCLVANIIVDISFNQLGGLSTLCFLEEVDRLIGNNHLFKRSVILIKAWCFYESRILGAHHGLLSTYALETLVLYVFHIFHQSLRGPLEVLFRFLQFFSKFDWNHYCLSLWGPIPITSLHNIPEAASLHNSTKPSLFTEAFLNSCRDNYLVCLEGDSAKPFYRKFMNVIDPLRINNNLGRSINRGNFVRIHSAFAYGALQLEKLMQCSAEDFENNFTAFFRNTQRHCWGKRPDAELLDDNPQIFNEVNLCNEKTRSEDVTREVLTTSGHYLDAMVQHSNCSQHIDDGDVCMDNDDANLVMEDSWIEVEAPCWRKSEEGMCFEEGKLQGGSMISSQRRDCQLNDTVSSLDKEKNDEKSDNVGANWEELERVVGCEDATDAPTGTPKTVTPVKEKLQVKNPPDHLANCFEALKFTLGGDFATHVNNLEAGRRIQNACLHRNLLLASHSRHLNQWGSVWEGPGRPGMMSGDMFAPFSSYRNGVHGRGGVVGPMPNGGLAESLPKLHKGTGTFFPNVRPGFEREKRVVSGARSQRKSSNTEYSGQNGTAGFRSRSYGPKKREGHNKMKAKNTMDSKSGERDWDMLTEFTAGQGGVHPLISFDGMPNTALVEGFSDAFFCNEMNVTNREDAPLMMSPSSNNGKGLSIEKLEFGSFGPGFLTGSFQGAPAQQEIDRCMMEKPQPPQHGDDELSESSHEQCSRAGSEADHCQSSQVSYQLNEEDFPPLTFQQEESGTFMPQKAPPLQLSYHQACLVGHPI